LDIDGINKFSINTIQTLEIEAALDKMGNGDTSVLKI
jgi:hypothetical protein